MWQADIFSAREARAEKKTDALAGFLFCAEVQNFSSSFACERKERRSQLFFHI